MDGCTNDRSLTPPLPTNLIASNGKPFISSLYDKVDQVDIGRSTSLSSIANKLGLSNYNSTSEDDEVTENHSKSTTNRCESTKSSVINAKNRKSEERDRKHRRNRRESKDSSPRRKSKDRKRHRSSSKHRSEDYKNRRKRSRSKGRGQFLSSKAYRSPIKETPIKEVQSKVRGEIRRTVTEPIIEYCENGRYPSTINSKQRNHEEPKQKVRRTNNAIASVNAVRTYEETDEEERKSSDVTTNRCSNTPKRDKIDTKVKLNAVEHEVAATSIKEEKCSKPNLKLTPDHLDLTPKYDEQIQTNSLTLGEDMFSNEEFRKIEVKSEELEFTPPIAKCESPVASKSPSKFDESMEVKSTTPERPIPAKTAHDKLNDSKVLSQDKLQQYIDEYEYFIQQVASPLNVSNANEQQQKQQQQQQQLRDQSKENSPKMDRRSTVSPPQPTKNNRKKSSSSSSSSSDSSDDDDDDSSSSSSSSSSNDSDSSDSDSSSSSDSDKSDSDSSSSRSSSKSPRPLKSKNVDCESDGLDFTVDNDKNNTQNLLQTPFSLSRGFSVNTLKRLGDLINFDDDDELLNSLQSYKKQIHEMKTAKGAVEKTKLDGSSSNEHRTNDNSKNLENGALLHENERQKISLTLKSTTPFKSQTNELESSVGGENQQQLQQQQQQQQEQDAQKLVSNDKPIVEQNDQSEKIANEKSMSGSKKKSSYRKDERKSRRSEDRKTRGSEERNRSKRNEDRRSRRSSEEKRLKRSEERRSKRSEERHSRRSEDRRSRRSEEKRPRRSEERRQKRRRQSPASPIHYRDSYYSPQYRNRSLSPMPPRGPRTPPNTPPPNSTEFDETAIRHMPYSTTVMPPSAHYQPGPNQFSAPNLPSNVPSYMNEYAAYMHPNQRMPVPQYSRPPPGISSPGMMAGMNTNNDYFYHTSPSQGPPPSHHLPNQQSMATNAFSNLIEVSPYGAQNSNVDYMRKAHDNNNRRKPAIAVQKGNVLEIVPSAEIMCDRNNESVDMDKSDKVHLIDKQHQQALQRQKQERLKRKMERHQKRIERCKRKEFLLAELNRLSHLMIFGDDGKIVKAGEILKSIVYDGTTVKLANAKELDEDDDMEELYVEPQLFTYDPQATVGRSILLERNDTDKSSTGKDSNVPKRKGVLFADGVAPGHGTSASENSENEADDNIIKPKKLSARAKNKKDQKNHTSLPTLPNESIPLFLEKENSFDTKSRDIEQQQIIPPPPPGSPPLHLPQPKLKDPDKFILNRVLYFHYDPRFNKMIVTETPPHLMPMMMAQPPPILKTNHIMAPMEPAQPPQPPFMYKSNNIRHHNDIKLSKSKTSSSKTYHSSSHKSLHPSNETNLIVLSSSPSNA